MLPMTPRTINWSGIYIGPTYPHLRGRRVSIVGVRKVLPAPEEPLRITSNDEPAALGGIAAGDRIDIAPALENGQSGAVVGDVPLEELDNAYWILHPPPRDSHIG
jgi:hypothetical protein